MEPPKIKSDTVSIVSPSTSHEVMGPDAMILVFWMLSFKPTFSLSSFTYIKRLFSFSLSATRVVSSAYLRLLIFLPAILIPVCASSNPAFLTLLLLLLLSRFSRVRLCATPETAAHQAPPSLGFSRQEHWSVLPFPSPMHESEKWQWSRSVVSDS